MKLLLVKLAARQGSIKREAEYGWSLKVYNYIMKHYFAYSFANNDGCHSSTLGTDIYRIDACRSSFAMIQA